MRRAALIVVCAAVALFPLAAGTSATGPGGWDHVGVGATSALPALNGAVYALNGSNPGVLYAGGNFTSAGGNATAARIASWSGGTWTAMPGLTNGAVFAIAYKAGNVYAGGTFQNAGGNGSADYLAVWNGSNWAPFCNATGAAFNADVKALQIIGNTLYVGGSFADAAGIVAADFLAACDLTTGAVSAVVDNDVHSFNSGVSALTADSNGKLYAGGAFINLEGVAAADHVASYSGGGVWQAMGSGPGSGGAAVDSFVRTLAASGTSVYVGTDSVDVAGIARADHVAKWNGSAWSSLGANTAGTDGFFPVGGFIYALATSGSLVLAGGSFQNADGVATADEIVYFDGTSWHPLGSNGAGNGPIGSQATAIATVNSKVYVGGSFTSAGGDTLAQYVASYALRLPDTWIGLTTTGPWSGNGLYSATAVGESKTRLIPSGSSGNYYIVVQNDGLVPATFTVRGHGGAANFTPVYFSGTTNVTAAVMAGTYSTGTIQPHASITIRLRVSLTASATGSASYFMTAAGSGAPTDEVKALATAQ